MLASAVSLLRFRSICVYAPAARHVIGLWQNPSRDSLKQSQYLFIHESKRQIIFKN